MIDTIVNSFDIWTDAQGIKSRTRVKSVNNISMEGIKKLRELILELAVSGKLVSQNPNDEPASELIKKIVNHRKQSFKNGKIHSQKQISVISREEEPFQLPNGWTWARLPEISEYNTGRTPSTKNPEYWSDKENGIPWISISDMSDFGYINESSKFVSSEASRKVFSENPVPVGTILMSFKLTIGKISILNIEAYHNEAIISINPFEGIDKDYLFKILPKRANKGNSKNALMGNTLNATSLALLLIPIPPLSEQQRIAAKVDELMALCDKLEEEQFKNLKTHQVLVKTLLETLTQATDANELKVAWERMSPHFDTLFCTDDSIDQLKQTILQLAVMGKLVKQDPNDEHASELLKKIEKEKEKLSAEGKIKKQGKLPIINENEKPFKIPKTWLWVRLGDVVEISGGKRLPNGYSLSRQPTPYCYIRVTDMKDNTIIQNDLHYISEDIFLQLKRYRIYSEDLYMTIVGATIGKCGIIPEELDGSVLTENAVRIMPILLSKYFLNLVLNASVMQKQFISETKKVGVEKMAIIRFKCTLMPLLPISEQNRIVSKVYELFALCESLKESVQKSHDIKVLLSKTIVEKAVL